MLCPRCNNEITDDSIFCSKCGYEIKNTEKPKLIDKIKNLDKKYIKYVLGAGAICIIIIVVIVITQNPTSRYIRAVNSSNYNEAKRIYDRSIKGNRDKEIQISTRLKSEINEIKKQFTQGKIEYNNAISKLDSMDKLSIASTDVSLAKSEINNLNNSRISFKKGREFLSNKDYKNAFVELKRVIKEDENYDKAKELINNSIMDYKNAILVECNTNANKEDYMSAIAILTDAISILPNDSDIIAKKAAYEKLNEEKEATELRKKIEEAKGNQELIVEKAAVVIQSSRYKSLYPDMIQVIVRNNTDKTVKNMVVSCLGFDANGYPLKVKAYFNFDGGSFEFLGNAENVNILPKAVFGKDVGWKLDEDHGIKTVLACVKEVVYYDGSEWSNPYYDYWIQEYKEKQLH